uniref:Putative canalicular multispecific organic anion transporter 1 n=1 Tax=Xenopsylla cheopis TaxID=163159 RepID=A0A6M2DUD6_XENCH
MYLGVYGALGIGQVLATSLSTVLMAFGTLNASKDLHNFLLQSVMKLPMSFLDTMPLGRLLSRFSYDVNVLDINLPMNLRQWLPSCFRVRASAIVLPQ